MGHQALAYCYQVPQGITGSLDTTCPDSHVSKSKPDSAAEVMVGGGLASGPVLVFLFLPHSTMLCPGAWAVTLEVLPPQLTSGGSWESGVLWKVRKARACPGGLVFEETLPKAHVCEEQAGDWLFIHSSNLCELL